MHERHLKDSIWKRNKPCALAMLKLKKKHSDDWTCIEYYWQQEAQKMWQNANMGEVKVDLGGGIVLSLIRRFLPWIYNRKYRAALTEAETRQRLLIAMLYQQLLGFEQNIIDLAEAL